MPTYNFYYGVNTTKTGGYLFLGKEDLPYDLKKGDVVIISENWMNMIKQEGFQPRPQYYVGSIHYWVDPVRTADVYLVE